MEAEKNYIITHCFFRCLEKSIVLFTLTYKYTEVYPTKGMYGITNRIRRSFVSIPTNIYISLGSFVELDTHLLIANNVRYISLNHYKLIIN